MTEERQISGIVANWASEIREIKPGRFYSVGVKIGSDWHNITANQRNALEMLKQTYPKGSQMSFTEVKKGNYWNVKDGSISGEGIVTATPTATATAATPTPVVAQTTTTTKANGYEIHDNRVTLGACFRQAFEAQLTAWEKAEEKSTADDLARAVAELAEVLFREQTALVTKLREEGVTI